MGPEFNFAPGFWFLFGNLTGGLIVISLVMLIWGAGRERGYPQRGFCETCLHHDADASCRRPANGGSIGAYCGLTRPCPAWKQVYPREKQ